MDYSIVSLNEHKELNRKYLKIFRKIWPPIMQHSAVAGECWDKLEKYFPEYQLFMVNRQQEIIGFANTIPLYWDKGPEQLPDEGWDWLIQKGISDHIQKLTPNVLGGLQIGVDKPYQGQGLSSVLINEVKKLYKQKNLGSCIIPIRPTLKHRYPLIPIEQYIEWKQDNRIFDPWIRTHHKNGARIIKICSKSMTFNGTVREWEEWSGIPVIGTGRYVFDGLLQPVEIDVTNNTGIYYDANIWIRYT